MSEQVVGRLNSICFVRSGVPGDAGAFERALGLAKQTEAALSIVSVLEEQPAGVLRVLAACGAGSETLAREEDQAAEVEKLVQAARQQGIEASGQLLHGAPGLDVIRWVLQHRPDLLIKSAQPSTGIRWVLFGHTDRQLMRKCPSPVLIERPSVHRTYHRILAAVDPDPFRRESNPDPAREELNVSILERSILLAQIEAAELHVVHAWPFHLEGPLQNRAGIADDAIARVGETFKQKHEQALGELLSPYIRHVARVHLLKGEAGEVISRVAATELVDTVVMGTLCRTGISGLLIGNTAETVIDQVDCSVLALKPRGFISPVEY